MRQRIKAVILDCDGVILDSNAAYEKMYEKLFAKYGINLKPKEIYMHFGENPKYTIRVIFAGHSIRAIWKDYVKGLRDPEVREKIKIHHGAKKTIIKMSKSYGVVVASGALRFRLLYSLKKFGLLSHLRFAMGSDEVRQAKPHPEMLLKIMKRLKVRRSETLFVGDAPNDLLASKRAGVKFVAVLSGVLDRTTARRMEADYIVKDINAVPKLLKRL